MIEPNERGEYVVAACNDANKAKTTDIVEKIHSLAKSDCAWFWKWNRMASISFTANKTLFSLGYERTSPLLSQL